MGGNDRGRDEREQKDDAGARPLRALTGRQLAPALAWAALAVAAALPVLLVHHIPSQDLPQHVAAIRVLTSLHDPAFGFDVDYVQATGRATYAVPYALGVGLARVIGVWGAGKALVILYLVGTLLGVRALARALGNDERAALLAAPILVNPLFVIGLLPFLLGLALLLWALASSVTFCRTPSARSGIVLGALAAALAGTHPIPFALFCVGHAAAVLARRRWIALVPPVPALVLFVRFLFATDSGRLVRGIVGSVGVGARTPLADVARDFPGWICDAFRDRSDDVLAALTLALAVVVSFLGRRERPDPRAALAFAIIPAMCLLLYAAGETQHGYTWPLAPRYAFVGALTLVPLVRWPKGARWATVAGATLAVAAFANDALHFVAFERETAGFDAVVTRIRPRARVAALMYESTSDVARFYPFLHFGSYYQVDRGGVVKFSFAGYDHWPIDFRDGRYPPPGAPAVPGWEWHPDRVSVEDEIAPYFDYVLVRGEGFHPPEGTFAQTFTEGRWQLWERRAAQAEP